MTSRRPALMFVHGLPLWRGPTTGWATYCSSSVIAACAEPSFFGYSRWSGLAALLWPHGRVASRLAREFLAAYERCRAAHGVPSVIAHSLGSYLVAQALSEHPGEVAFRGVVLFGSLVRPDYDWASAIARGQVPARRLRNEVGLHDWPLRWAQLLGRAGYPYGPAGLEGFTRVPGRPSINHPYAGAANAQGLARYCQEVWLPFLGFTGRPARSQTPSHHRARCRAPRSRRRAVLVITS